MFLCRPCSPAALFREPPRFKGDLRLGYDGVAEPLHKACGRCTIPNRNHSASGFINLPSIIHHGERAVSILALPPLSAPLPLLLSQSEAGLIIGDSEDPRHHLPPPLRNGNGRARGADVDFWGDERREETALCDPASDAK